MEWEQQQGDPDLSRELGRLLALPESFARLLVHRGIFKEDAARHFLYPALTNLTSPWVLKGMDQATARILKAIKQDECVAVFGDYDADGITATALLVRFLLPLLPRLIWRLPNRMKEGYGLSPEAVRELSAKGVTLLITADCGITNRDEVALARELGMEVIVTDHHTPSLVLPQAAAIINPKQEGCAYPFKELAGVGVAFQLIIALRRVLAEAGLFDQGIPNLTPYLDLVALGTVADMAPLTGENRILVKRGLQVLAKSPRPGLTALKEVSLITPEGDMDPWMISFRLAPRLNAPGRMGDPQDALKLLLSENPEESRRLAQELDQQNSRRQSREQEILKEAFRLLETDPSHTNRKALVLLGEGWPKGILGLIASRLVERFQKPVFVLAREGDYLEGSGRSIPGFDLAGNLSLLAPLLLRYGGHPQAAGVKLSPANLPAFSRQLEDLAAETLKTGDLTPRLLIEGELGLNTLEKEIYPHLPLLAPFGTGNPEPVFCLNGIAVREAVLVKGGHLKLTLHQNGTTVQAIGFGLGECHPQISTQVSLAFTLKTTPFRGNPYLQLKIKDLPLKS